MVYTLANVDEGLLSDIKTLENELGTPVLAMEAVKVQPARLDREKLDRIQKLEDKLGVVLVAVES